MSDENAFLRLESEVRAYCRFFPVVVDTAADSRVFTEDGSAYLDFLAGASALNYGHNHPAIIQPLQNYLARGGILLSLDLYTTSKRDFIESFERRILQPRGLDYKLQFTGPTGTNAVEAALKLARKVTGRPTIAAFTRGFHGVSLGSLAATTAPGSRKGSGVPLTFVSHLPFCDYFGPSIDTVECIERMLAPGGGIDLPAAFIVETVQGTGGVNVASFDWLQRLAALAKSKGILLIVDDIQVGCGRTGPFFSFERANIEPDIVCLSKSISGCGLPMSVVLMKPEYDQWAPGEHNGVFRGNNLAFVAAVAALETFWTDSSLEQETGRKATIVHDRLERIVRRLAPRSAEVRGVGLFQAMAWEDPDIAGAVSREAFERHLIIETCGPRSEVLKVLPPLTITDGDLIEGLDIIEASVVAVAASRRLAG
jgi:diaminobutyrate-2-oxoglutarate transaminase